MSHTRTRTNTHTHTHGRRNRGAGGGGQLPPPPIFCQPKKIKSLKIMTHKSLYSNKDTIGF